MTERARRRELTQAYVRTGTAAGVYRIRNRVSGRALIGSTSNLAGVRSRLAFAVSTTSAAALEPRLRPDVERDGFDALEFEVLDVLPAKEGATPADVEADLRVLEEMRRAEADPGSLY